MTMVVGTQTLKSGSPQFGDFGLTRNMTTLLEDDYHHAQRDPEPPPRHDGRGVHEAALCRRPARDLDPHGQLRLDRRAARQERDHRDRAASSRARRPDARHAPARAARARRARSTSSCASTTRRTCWPSRSGPRRARTSSSAPSPASRSGCCWPSRARRSTLACASARRRSSGSTRRSSARCRRAWAGSSARRGAGDDRRTATLDLLRARMQFTGAGIHGPTILVADSGPDMGKSIVTANLGAALARGGKRVVVVDADLRRPRLHRSLGVELDGRPRARRRPGRARGSRRGARARSSFRRSSSNGAGPTEPAGQPRAASERQHPGAVSDVVTPDAVADADRAAARASRLRHLRLAAARRWPRRTRSPSRSTTC